MPLGSVGMKLPLNSVCLLVVGKVPICVIEAWHLITLSRIYYIKMQNIYIEPWMGHAAALPYVKRTSSPCVCDR